MPWNAALATLVVAGFVTLLWRSEPVPEARMDSEPVVRSEAPPAAPPTASSSVESQPSAVEAATSPAGEPSEARPAAPVAVAPRVAKPTPTLKAPAAPTLAPAPASELARGLGPSSNGVERASQAMSDHAAEAEDARMAQKTQGESSPARMARRLEGERVKPAERPEAEAIASALRPPTSIAAATVPQGLGSRPQASPSAREALLLPALPVDWTHFRRLPDGAPMARAQAGQLPELLAALRAGEASPQGGALSVLQRVELLRNGQGLGELMLYAQGWRYRPADSAQAERAGRLDAPTAARLSAELERLTSAR